MTQPTPPLVAPQAQAVLHFWFEDTDPRQWWAKDEDFDALIRQRFLALHQQAARCELFAWRATPQGRLAEVIVLDQFSRNMFRDTAEAFAQDRLALALAQEAVAAGADLALQVPQRGFLYLPFMHSESLLIHDEALRLYQALGQPGNLDFEHRHRAILERFGRYPHRNIVLGRDSTAEELAFLQQPGSSF